MLTSMTGSFQFGHRPAITGAGGGGGGIGGSGGGNGITDGGFNTTMLLVHANGTNGASNNTFLDGSTNAYSVTRNGTPTQGTFSPFSQTGWSAYFSGTSGAPDWISTASSSIYNVSSGNWTIEAWFYNTSTDVSSRYITFTPASGTVFGLIPAGGNYFAINQFGASSPVTTSGNTVKLNQWSHIAIVKNSSTTTIYVDGASVGSGTVSWSNSAHTIYFGGNGGSYAYNYNGWISNARIVMGTALYSGSTYTVPTAPLTAITNTQFLTLNNNRFYDSSNGNAVLLGVTTGPTVQSFSPFAPVAGYSTSTVGGSVYLNGTTDYLSVNAITYPTVKLGSGDFTLECWVYITTHRNYNTIYDSRASTTSAGGLVLACNSSGQLYVYNNGYVLASGGGSAATAITANAWHHVALVRSGAASGNLALYVDGARVTVSSAASSTNLSDAVCAIGYGIADGGYYFLGYISSFRIMVGAAQYSGTTYTIPTVPFTAITSTQLLLNGTNGAILDQTSRHDLIVSGSAAISTAQKKFGTGSLYFNGSTDYITTAGTNMNLMFGTGAFTMEHWVKFTATTSYINSMGDNSHFTTTNNFLLMWNYAGAGRLTFWINNAGVCSTTNAYNDNAWHHVAVTRTTAGVITIWVDGTADGTASGYGSTNVGTGSMIIGNQAQMSRYWSGYIDEIRISKTARYTSTFTPSAVEFGDQ